MKNLSGGIDIGSEAHHVIISNEEGNVLYDKRILHKFSEFHEAVRGFKEVEEREDGKISFAIEGKNGYGAPFDRILIENGFSLYNIDNLKLRRFRDVFGAEWRNDRRDAKMLSKLMNLKPQLDGDGRKVFMPINKVPVVNEKLKIISRHQKTLINEKTRMQNRLGKKVLEICPDILDIGDIDSKKILRVLIEYPNFSDYKEIKETSLSEIKSIGIKSCKKLAESLGKLECVEELADVYATVIYSYAKRVLELKEEIESLDKKLDEIGKESKEVKIMRSIRGVATKLSSRFVGEIGYIKRFSYESEVAVYCGITCVDDESGKQKKSRVVYKANKMCKDTIIEIAGCTIRYIPECKNYYAKKRKEGKTHNQALRCLARQLIKVIFKMLTEERDYITKEVKEYRKEAA